MTLNPKFPNTKVYPFVNKINKAMNDVCQDGTMACLIEFYYLSEEKEEMLVHKIDVGQLDISYICSHKDIGYGTSNIIGNSFTYYRTSPIGS